MRFMNEWDIDRVLDRWGHHPVLGPATRTLSNLKDAANANSDGWHVWPKPARSAAKLMALIEGDGIQGAFYDDERADATPEKLRAAYSPIKAFRTRSGIAFEIVEVPR